MTPAVASRGWNPDTLKRDLDGIHNWQSDAFVYYPSEGEMRHPPVSIWFAAWAIDLAESLHENHGSRVRLVVGNMEYPSRRLQGRPALLTGWRFDEGATPMISHEMTVSTEHPLVVQTGHKLRGYLTVHNLDGRTVRLSFDGPPEFTGIVIDRSSGVAVNGTFRALDAQQACIDVAPRGDARVALVVDTASSNPDLGYAVPAGTWEVQVVVFANGQRLLSPRLPFIVTSLQVTSPA